MSRNATNAVDLELSAQDRKMTPADFRNVPTNNNLGVDPEVLMTYLAKKTEWPKRSKYGLTSPLKCAAACHIWSNEYLEFHGEL